MEENFRPMRRIKQLLTNEQCEEILNRGTYGVHKIDSMRAHDKVCFTVVDKDDVVKDEYTTYFRSVIAFGRVRFIEDETEKRQALVWLGERFNPGDKEGLDKEMAKGFSHLHMVEITIDHLTGKEAIELVRARKANG